jgi:hypothetical protein
MHPGYNADGLNNLIVNVNGTFDFGVQLTTVASAHAAATVLGGLQNTVVGAVSGGGVQINNVAVRSKSGLLVQIDIYFFRSQPSVAWADGDSFTLSDADKLLMPAAGKVSVIPAVGGSLATQAIAAATNLGLCMKTDTAKKIWWVAVAAAAVTPASTSEYQVAVNGLTDRCV